MLVDILLYLLNFNLFFLLFLLLFLHWFTCHFLYTLRNNLCTLTFTNLLTFCYRYLLLITQFLLLRILLNIVWLDFLFFDRLWYSDKPVSNEKFVHSNFFFLGERLPLSADLLVDGPLRHFRHLMLVFSHLLPDEFSRKGLHSPLVKINFLLTLWHVTFNDWCECMS